MAPRKRKAAVVLSDSSADDLTPLTQLIEKDDQENDDKSADEQKPQYVILPPYLMKRNPRTFCIPVGPDFQAAVPDFTEVSDLESYQELTKDSKWLRTRVWTPEPDADNTDIGQGRPSTNCRCRAPRSEECARLHVSEKRAQLKLQLSVAFEAWGFDTMGEDVSNSWTSTEERIFGVTVSRKKRLLQPKTTVKLGKSYMEIISYYFNVLVLRRVCVQARRGDLVDSDDDTYVGKRRKTRGSQVASASSKYLKCPEPSITNQ